jgi:hypothetical protein
MRACRVLALGGIQSFSSSFSSSSIFQDVRARRFEDEQEAEDEDDAAAVTFQSRVGKQRRNAGFENWRFFWLAWDANWIPLCQ